SRMVPTTLGWLWPSAVTAMPPVKSRYSLPSLSHTRTPSPRTRTTGLRLAVYIRCLSDHSISVFVSVMSESLSGCYRRLSSNALASPVGCGSQDCPIRSPRLSAAAHKTIQSARLACRLRLTRLSNPLASPVGCGSQDNLGPDALLGEDLEEDRVGHAAIDDVG